MLACPRSDRRGWPDRALFKVHSEKACPLVFDPSGVCGLLFVDMCNSHSCLGGETGEADREFTKVQNAVCLSFHFTYM